MQEIHKKVMSLDYGDFKAEIKTVDSQDSLMGGVLVMVSGSLSCKSTGKRNFTQSFFLAPQEKGYFVLNDIFRYLDEAPPPVSKPAPSLPNGVPELPLAPEPAIEGHVVVEMESREFVSPPSIDSEVGMEEKVDITEQEALEVQDNEPAEDIAQVDISSPNNEEPASPPVQSYSSPSPPSHPLEEDSTSTGEKPKVSYASILRLRNAGGSAAPAFHSAPKAAQPAPEASAAPTVSSSSPASGDTHHTLDENAPHEAEGLSPIVKSSPHQQCSIIQFVDSDVGRIIGLLLSLVVRDEAPARLPVNDVLLSFHVSLQLMAIQCTSRICQST
jgi:hypothetical protein